MMKDSSRVLVSLSLSSHCLNYQVERDGNGCLHCSLDAYCYRKGLEHQGCIALAKDLAERWLSSCQMSWESSGSSAGSCWLKVVADFRGIRSNGSLQAFRLFGAHPAYPCLILPDKASCMRSATRPSLERAVEVVNTSRRREESSLDMS